ncbi:glycerol channel [Asimina triloba]
MAAAVNGKTTGMRSVFLQAYARLKSELLQDPAFGWTEDSLQWIDQLSTISIWIFCIYRYYVRCPVPTFRSGNWCDEAPNVRCRMSTALVGNVRPADNQLATGKLNRGLSVIDSYKLLKGQELNDDEVFLSCALGWCIEWVNMIAVNDGILLRNHIPRILRKHFREKPYYVDLLDLFNEVLIAVPNYAALALSFYDNDHTSSLQELDTKVNSPVACALLMAGEKLENFTDVKNILIEMGTYFQVQDDYLDCFGDPEVIGKENYGKPDAGQVAKVKALYRELDLKNTFLEYERQSYEKLIASIEAHPSKPVQEVLMSFLGKIYKRQK